MLLQIIASITLIIILYLKVSNDTIKLTLTAKIYKMDQASKFSQPGAYFWIESKCDDNWNIIPETKEWFDIYIPGANNLYYSIAFNATKDFRIGYNADNLLYNAALCFSYSYQYYPRGRLFISIW